MRCCRPKLTKKTINDLPAATAAALEDLFEVTQYDSATGEFTSRKQTLQLIADLIAEEIGPGGGGGSNNIHGGGSPLGVVTPDAVDQFYRDEDGPGLWQAIGETNLDWYQWS